MRLARFAEAGKDPAYGIIELEVDAGEHPNTVAVLNGDPLAGMKVNYTGERHDLSDVRLLAPVIPRSKVIGIARNYDEESGVDRPTEPVTFLKPNTSVIGPNESIVLPSSSKEVFFEGELAVIIGRICRFVTPQRVPDVIFGYTIANDITARNLQTAEPQWTRAKGYDTFCPLGPWINTHNTLEEIGHLRIETKVNGLVKQNASTSQMRFSISDLVCFISEFTTLLPGDVILTGTPAGSGPVSAGDEIAISISGLGTLTNQVVAS